MRKPRPFLPAPTARALAALPALLLAACLFETGEKRVAGGAEDFPNTFAALGGAASGNLAAQGEWDQFGNIPRIDLAGADTLVAAPPAKRGDAGGLQGGAEAGALAKGSSGTTGAARGAAPDTTWDYADTASRGVARRFIREETARLVRTDTTVIRWDDRARDGVAGDEFLLERRGGELVKPSLRLTAYRYENLDSAGGFDRAAFYEAERKAATGVVHHRLIVARPGPDGDFAAKADNRPVYFATARTLGGDTLDAFDVSDADGDGQLWGEHDSGMVDVRHRQTDPFLRPQVASFTQRMRAMLFRQAGRTYPVAYTETRTDRDGRRVTFTVKGHRMGADSAFGPGDTVQVTVRTVPSPEAESRFAERAARYRIRLSPEPGAFGGNRLLRSEMETQWREGAFRRGRVTATRLVFVPDAPAAPGSLDVTGEVRLEATFADGTEGTLEGRYAERRIAADLVELRKAGKVGRYKVVWQADEEGTVLSQESLPD